MITNLKVLKMKPLNNGNCMGSVNKHNATNLSRIKHSLVNLTDIFHPINDFFYNSIKWKRATADGPFNFQHSRIRFVHLVRCCCVCCSRITSIIHRNFLFSYVNEPGKASGLSIRSHFYVHLSFASRYYFLWHLFRALNIHLCWRFHFISSYKMALYTRTMRTHFAAWPLDQVISMQEYSIKMIAKPKKARILRHTKFLVNIYLKMFSPYHISFDGLASSKQWSASSFLTTFEIIVATCTTH